MTTRPLTGRAENRQDGVHAHSFPRVIDSAPNSAEPSCSSIALSTVRMRTWHRLHVFPAWGRFYRRHRSALPRTPHGDDEAEGGARHVATCQGARLPPAILRALSESFAG
jgi:hypothetical protein